MPTMISLVRAGVIVFTLLVAVVAIHFCNSATIETFPALRVSATNATLNANPTTNSTPSHQNKPRVALPSSRTPAPSFPIILTQPDPVNLHSWQIKYIGADNLLRDDCIREIMANTIPRDRILPSSMGGGFYNTPCNAEMSLPYHPWPF